MKKLFSLFISCLTLSSISQAIAQTTSLTCQGEESSKALEEKALAAHDAAAEEYIREHFGDAAANEFNVWLSQNLGPHTKLTIPDLGRESSLSQQGF